MTRAAAAVTLALVAIIALAGCRDRYEFVCVKDAECVRNGAQGTCTVSPIDGEKFCVFSDSGCPAGRWDATAAEAIANACVGEEMLDMSAGASDGGTDFSIPFGADLANLDASINLTGCGTSTATLFSVWGTSQDDVWAVGSAGTIWHFRGPASCEVQQSGGTDTLRGVWARNANDVYVVGDHATLLHSTDKGATWLPAQSGPTSDYNFWAVGGTDTATYAAVESFHTPATEDGSLWTTPNSDGRNWTDLTPTLKAVIAMSGIEPLDTISSTTTGLWTGGGNVESFHLSGSTWTHNSVTTTPGPNGYWSSFSGVGARLLTTTNNGEIWRLDGATWTRAFDQAAGLCNNGLLGIYAVPGRAYAVGYSGCIAVSADDGVTWRAFDAFHPAGGPNNPNNDSYNAVWIDPVSQLVVLVGQDVNGNAVVRQNPPTP